MQSNFYQKAIDQMDTNIKSLNETLHSSSYQIYIQRKLIQQRKI